MLHAFRITSVGVAMASAILLALAPVFAFAAFWPGFPFAPVPNDIVIQLPGSFNLCVKTVTAASIKVQVPKPCPKDTTPPPTPQQPTLTFTANPTSIQAGDSSTLTWNSTDATACTASGGWSGSKSLDGSQSVTPAATTNYVLTCTNGGNNVVKDVTVTVTPAPVSPTLTLQKTVTNDDGGAAVAADFQAKIDGGNVPWGTPQTVTVGSHTASETNIAGYSAGAWGGDCVADGTVTLAAGENKMCTITNNDIAASPTTATLTVVKVVVNNDLGTKEVSDFALFVDATPVISGAQNAVATGVHTVGETADSGYTATISGDCASDGSITLAVGDVKTCTITNDDNVPSPPVGALLITEVLYDIATSTQGAETTDEWVEIRNGTNGQMDLSGYALKDNSGAVGDVFPAGTIVPAGGFLMVVGTSTTPNFWAFPLGTIVLAVDGDIGGNGLANANDRVVLHDTTDVVVDSVGWGTDTVAFGVASGLSVSEGSSLARTPQTTDTNSSADWAEDTTPNPGQ